MGQIQYIRQIKAAERRQQRESKQRQRELERQAKEMAKLSALQQAQLEVETYENELEVLLSVHKEQADAVDWPSLATALPPAPPVRQSYHELRSRQRLAIATLKHNEPAVLQKARQQDEIDFHNAEQAYASEQAEWAKQSALAKRILKGEHDAYIDAIHEFNPFIELAGIGSSLHFTVHSAKCLECSLTTYGRKAIPAEVKSLTASGKVSIKKMSRTRFVEIYQDYICGCVLRVARELFGLLPIETLLINATAEGLDTSTGQMIERPFLSVVITRATHESLNYEKLDPSDAIMNLTHCGDLKESRKTGDFEFIAPLSVAELPQEKADKDANISALLAAVVKLRSELTSQTDALRPMLEEEILTVGES